MKNNKKDGVYNWEFNWISDLSHYTWKEEPKAIYPSNSLELGSWKKESLCFWASLKVGEGDFSLGIRTASVDS